MAPKIVLFIFPPVPHVYNISPFGIKVESFLRINKISYDVVYTSKFGPKKKIPYIHVVDSDDGTILEVIPDSNVILSRLQEIFQLPRGDLTIEQEAMSHLMIRTLDEHTAQIGFYFRYVLQSEAFMKELEISNRFFHADTSRMGKMIAPLFAKGMKKGFGKKMYARGLSQHSDQELWQFSNDDIVAASRLLGSNKYLFGDDKATLADCALFAHLCQFLYMPLDFPQKRFMETDCPNLIKFIERFRAEFWSDWDEKCQRKPNQKMLERTENKGNKGMVIKFMLPAMLVAGFAYILKRGLL